MAAFGLSHALLAAAATVAFTGVSRPHTSPDSLEGLWTRVPSGRAALHDAVRVGASGEAKCSHGGWLNMTALSCPWQSATLQLRGAASVSLMM